MRDDASLRRLAEMGVDVYVTRSLAIAASVDCALLPMRATPDDASLAATPDAARVTEDAPPASASADVLLLADMQAYVAKPLLADVSRALKFAHIVCMQARAEDATAFAAAVALVMFGDAQARAAGALLPAQHQREVGWVVCGEPAALAGNAQGKRALWSELKRMARGLAARRAVRSADVVDIGHREY